MELDRNGLEVLEREECVKLLSTARFGRIGVTMGGLPVILPVAFTLTTGGIVVRTGLGTKLSAAARNAIVAFEVDDVDEHSRSGWSVSVTGFAREVTDRDEIAQLDRLVLVPWIGVQHAPHYVVISTEVITGRRIWVSLITEVAS